MKYVGFLLVVFSLVSCSDFSYSGEAEDVPTAGNVKVGFDKGDSLMVQQWIEVFHSKYPKANIIPVFKETEELVSDWLKDSIQGIFVHKKFEKEELNWLEEEKNSTINELQLGKTSMVFIASKESGLDYVQFDGQLGGQSQISKWYCRSQNMRGFQLLRASYFNDTNAAGQNKINMVPTYSDVNTVMRTISSPDAVGIVSLNTIADKRDSLSLALRDKVKILPVRSKNGNEQYPFQSQIVLNQYPFIQPLMCYESQGYSGLIKGFVIYTNSQSGQALLQKSGLIPHNYQGRKIQIKVD